MHAKIVQILLFPLVAFLVLFSGSELPGPAGEPETRPLEDTLIIQQAPVRAGWWLPGPRIGHAADKRFEDYWGDSEWDSKGQKMEDYFNIFLKTGNPYIKAAVFAALAVILYLITWALFRSLIMKNKSPAKAFVYSFFGFFASVYICAFICFSEYAMIQMYDPNELYMFQLNWMTVLISLGIWAIFSVLLTYTMKGKA